MSFSGSRCGYDGWRLGPLFADRGVPPKITQRNEEFVECDERRIKVLVFAAPIVKEAMRLGLVAHQFATISYFLHG